MKKSNRENNRLGWTEEVSFIIHRRKNIMSSNYISNAVLKTGKLFPKSLMEDLQLKRELQSKSERDIRII